MVRRVGLEPLAGVRTAVEERPLPYPNHSPQKGRRSSSKAASLLRVSDLVFELQSETAERSRARVSSDDRPKRVTGWRAICMGYASLSLSAATETRHRDAPPDRGSSLSSTSQGKDWAAKKLRSVDYEK